MQVFKAFFKLVWKYKIGMFLYFGLCAMMTVLVASQYDSDDKNSSYSNNSYTLIVKDNDNTKLSNAIVDYLKTQHDVEYHDYTEDELKDLIYSEFYTAYVEIPQGFMDKHLDEDALQIKTLYDTGKASGSFVILQLDSFTQGILRYENAGFDLDSAIKNTKKAVETENFVILNEKSDDSDSNSKLYSLLLFLPYGIMSIVLWSLLPVVLKFSSKDIKSRTAISSISSHERALALFAGSMIVCACVYIAMLILSGCFLKEYLFTEKWYLAAFNLLVFTLVNGAFLMFFASFPSNSMLKAKDVLINIISIAFSFLGGIFVPLELLGNDVRNVGKFLPTYWYAVGLRKIEAGSSFADVASCFGMQAIFGVLCLAAGLAISRVYMYAKES
ncbi:MAG: ABC transporter permease [Lachnospiraceae bacterium]|nr:ABC transporter permease [Lachnospiraceae bacterium]